MGDWADIWTFSWIIPTPGCPCLLDRSCPSRWRERVDSSFNIPLPTQKEQFEVQTDHSIQFKQTSLSPSTLPSPTLFISFLYPPLLIHHPPTREPLQRSRAKHHSVDLASSNSLLNLDSCFPSTLLLPRNHNLLKEHRVHLLPRTHLDYLPLLPGL